MINTILFYLGIFFAIHMFGYATYILAGTFVSVWVLYRQRLRERMRNEIHHDFYFPVSILVPAFNEEKTIVTTVNNLLYQDYKKYEIIIIDDGSTDNTANLVIDTYNLQKSEMPIRRQVPCKNIKELYHGDVKGKSVVLIRKENGGNKADAINAGINVSQYPYFVSMDADEVLQANALKYSARLFLENDNVIAVGGLIRIANGIKFENAMPLETKISRNHVVSMQIIEYNRAFMASRIFQNTFNGNLNISGGYGLFKKKAVIEVGGYDTKSVGEDMDLVLKLHIYFRSKNIPYSMKYTSDAVCWTQAPPTLKDLRKQRSRWQRGLIQAMWKHRVLFLNLKHGVVSLVSFMHYFFYELMAPIIELLGVLVIGVALFLNVLNIKFAILIALLYTSFSLLQTILFYMSKYFLRGDKYYKGDFLWFLYMCFADVIFFRPLLFIVRLSVFIGYKKNLHNWNKIERESME